MTEHFFSNPNANFIYNINAQFHRVYGAKGREGIKLQLNMNYTMLRERWDPPPVPTLLKEPRESGILLEVWVCRQISSMTNPPEPKTMDSTASHYFAPKTRSVVCIFNTAQFSSGRQ
ncbi:hypothetical protein BC827DRAFT_1152855 [Russula dissimulans]|nr:hypothetical protein BC827DRAFT_1152855 [Russula dissimulans]